MPCEYTLNIKLTKPLKKEAREKVTQILNQLQKKFNAKDLTNFTSKNQFKGKNIIIKVKSNENTCTNLVVQIKRSLKQELGKSFKIGVKALEVKDYKVKFELEKKALKKVSVPFADSLKIRGLKAELTYKKLEESVVRNHNVERTINLVKEKILKQHYEGKAEYHKILYTSKKIRPAWDKDPSEEMERLGWIIHGPTKGKWFFRPQITAILRAFEKLVMKEIIEPLSFKEVVGSNIISAEKIWVKTGHMVGMPMELYYVCEPKSRNPEEWEEFIDIIKITREVPYKLVPKLLQEKPLMGLTYAQCPIIYWSFKNKVIADRCLPVLLFDRTQNSFRYESGGRHGIERVDEFHRIEIVFIGTPKQVIEIKDKLLERYKHIFNDIMEIEWRTAWVTPFYMQQSGEIKTDDKEKIKGTIDFEAWMPYRGSREKSKWLEFQNLSIVGNKYINAFSIKGQTKELWSGCTGIGLERWAAIFLAQHGLNPNKWPEKFKKYLAKLPEGFKLF